MKWTFSYTDANAIPVGQSMSKERAAEHYGRVTRQLTSTSIFGVDPLAEHTNLQIR